MKIYHSHISRKIFSHCDTFGDEIMIEDISGTQFSGSDYKRLALLYAHKLQSYGIERGDSVVVFIRNVPEFSCIALAVLLIGAKLVIIEPDMGERVFEEKLQFLNPDCVIIEPALYYLLKIPLIKNISKIKKYQSLLKYGKNIILGCAVGNTDLASLQIEEQSILGDDEALIVFTGGTTGQPKGVVHTLESLEVMFERTTHIIGDQTKVFYADLPHFVLIGVSVGAKVIVGENNISDKKFFKVLEQYAVDTTFSPPYRYLRALGDKELIPKSIKHICLGSAPVYTSFLEKLYNAISQDTKVSCIYGMTEILPVSYIDGKEKLEQNKDMEGDLLGKPFHGISISYAKDGELLLSGKGLCKRYLGQSVMKVHSTGDIASCENDYLVMKGRKKDMILRKDYNIYPSLYEPIINVIPGIQESALVGVFDEKLQDEKLILFIEHNSRECRPAFPTSDTVIQKQILSHLQSGKYSIDRFALPDEIILLEEIPRIGRQNKIDKRRLRENYVKRVGSTGKK